VESSTFLDDNLQVSTFSPITGGGTSSVRNCSMLGGSVKLMQGTLRVENSILRSEDPIVVFSVSGDVIVQWSDVQGGWPGTGNIDADPLWADAANGDFSLLPGSPCIDTGSPFLEDPDGSILDMGALPYDPWTALGGGVAGTNGAPRLTGAGWLKAGSPLSLELTEALPGGSAILVVGLSALEAPLKGGTLWPQPDVLLGPLPVQANGTVALDGTWPTGLPTGFAFWSQAWLADAAAVAGFAASNGLRGVQP
jgi:hypothetical protein